MAKTLPPLGLLLAAGFLVAAGFLRIPGVDHEDTAADEEPAGFFDLVLEACFIFAIQADWDAWTRASKALSSSNHPRLASYQTNRENARQ